MAEKKIKGNYFTQILNGYKGDPGEPEKLEQITFQKGWLSPGKQIERLIEAGERLEIYRDENYDEFYFNGEEPSINPLRTAEDIQDELLIAQNSLDKAKKARERLKSEYDKAVQKELEKQAKKQNEKATEKQEQTQKTETDQETPK
jgi:hypothetical protein